MLFQKSNTYHYYILSGLMGVLFFSILFYSWLDVKNINWLMALHDGSIHYTGWLFYRIDEWTFPLGLSNNLGGAISFTDSIPLIAILLKIFDTLLPDNFQYFGVFL